MKKGVLAALFLLLPAGVNAADLMAGTRANLYFGGGSINPSDGSSDFGAAFGLRLEQFRPGALVGGGIDAKAVYTGKGDGHSGGYGQLELYRRVLGSSPDGLWFGFAFGYLGWEWQDRSFYYDGQKEKAEWGGVSGAYAAPAVRLNLLGNALSVRAQYYLFTSGEQKLQYRFGVFEDTYLSPSADFKGFSVDVALSKEWKPGYFVGLNANFSSIKFDSADATDPVSGAKVHLDSVRVNTWSVGLTVGLRW
jgi:hypothetical protein